MNSKTKLRLRKTIQVNFDALCTEVHNMKQKPLDLDKLQRKFQPFLRTTRFGDSIYLGLRNTEAGIRITQLPTMEHFSPRVQIYSNLVKNQVIDITVDTNKELMSKILFKHKLLNIDAYVD